MFEPSSDMGTLIPAGDSAIVYSHETQEFIYYQAKRKGDDIMPRLEMLLGAFLVKSRDNEWVEELLEEVFGDYSDQ